MEAEFKPTGGNVIIRSHLIEVSGSSEAWYVLSARHRFDTARAQRLERVESAPLGMEPDARR